LIFKGRSTFALHHLSGKDWKEYYIAKSLASSQPFPKWADNWCQNAHLATTWCLSAWEPFKQLLWAIWERWLSPVLVILWRHKSRSFRWKKYLHK